MSSAVPPPGSAPEPGSAVPSGGAGKPGPSVPTGAPPKLCRRERRRHELAHSSLRRGLRPSTRIGAGVYIGTALGVLWVVAAVDAIMNDRLLRFGITPRTVHGLPGIGLAPFLHADVGQLAANTLPFLVLGWFVLVSNVRTFCVLTLLVIAVSGGVDWALGPAHAVLVGANGVIFGWFGYLIARAWYSRQLAFIAIAVLVLAVFSSMLSGLLPALHHGVFWGGHVAAVAVGILVAWAVHRRRRDAPVPV